ncbi:MAG TPA: hypothetical protein VF706_03930, partial [Solirubrobacteraceae bacterium]
RLGERAEELLRGARECGVLSSRGEDRVLRVARTIADLNGAERVERGDVTAAIALRGEGALAAGRAA